MTTRADISLQLLKHACFLKQSGIYDDSPDALAREVDSYAASLIATYNKGKSRNDRIICRNKDNLMAKDAKHE